MKTVKVSAPGKLHLLGEHAVVYNKPAILAAVGKRCFVEINPRKDNNITVSSSNFKKEVKTNVDEIRIKFNKTQKDWETYNKINDIALLKSITKDPLDYPLIIIGQFLDYFKLKSVAGFDLHIQSEIPVGAGMGSSGALAVSIIGALSLFTNKPFEKETINKIAFLAEQKKHGKPSGGDNSTSCFGGLVWFKKDEGLKPLDADLPKEVTKNFYIINTGTPAETTGEMVSLVRDLVQKDPDGTQKIFDDQESLVKSLLPALAKSKHSEIVQIIKDGEANLESLGVVSAYAEKIIRNVEKSGGAAKICGAGGKTKSTGIILIYHRNEEKLKNVAKKSKLSYSEVLLGAQGVRTK
jgi:mevalonate kinase